MKKKEIIQELNDRIFNAKLNGYYTALNYYTDEDLEREDFDRDFRTAYIVVKELEELKSLLS